MTILMNQGVYIDTIVQSVMENMILGAILAVLILILFLKDIKPTLVIACSIPLSVVFAIVLMYFTGISLNIISLSGLALGVGMLVDNSIVVIENIYRLRNQGLSIRKAAVEGAGQVAGAILHPRSQRSVCLRRSFLRRVSQGSCLWILHSRSPIR